MTAIDELCCCLEQAYLLDLVDMVTPGVFMDGQKRMCHTQSWIMFRMEECVANPVCVLTW